jgi:hypothetical protein
MAGVRYNPATDCQTHDLTINCRQAIRFVPGVEFLNIGSPFGSRAATLGWSYVISQSFQKVWRDKLSSPQF